ncbi:MAG: CopG family transcriptional regulator [Eubacteriales bacterium]|nr:CopG family transcriptional regulator [Eubacteriales bacterium]
MNDNPLIIKKRGEDGSTSISLRIKDNTLIALDRLCKECNYSRNELINVILKYGIDNLKVVENSKEKKE